MKSNDGTTRKILVAALAILLFGAWAIVSVENPPNAEAASKPVSDTHVFDEVTPGVYFASGSGRVHTASNAMVIVNDEDVVIVDSHITPDAARALINSVKAVTDQPIRYLINSHFHFDHAHGNQVFPDGVEIIGHEYTREKLLGDVLNEPTYKVMGSPAAQQKIADSVESQLASASANDRAAIELKLTTLTRHIKALDEIEPTPPTITVTQKMSLFRGSREIQILHLGRGHTGGDLVVYLPAEKVLFTGDLFYDGAPYLGDSFPEEFITTLEALKKIEFEVIVAGHGPLVVRDPKKIAVRQDYIRRYIDDVAALRKKGRSAKQAGAEMSFATYSHFPNIESRNRATVGLEVTRIYQALNGRL